MSDPSAVIVRRSDRGTLELCAPTVGWWIRGPHKAAWIGPGSSLGWIEVLGRATPLVAPTGVVGRVVERFSPDLDRVAVQFRTVLVELDPQAMGSPPVEAASDQDVRGSEAAWVFRAPMSGRVYRRPSPDEPPFVEKGAVIERGQTVCLLEVMKTFNRVTYGGVDLPERARVVGVTVADGEDVASQDPILELEVI